MTTHKSLIETSVLAVRTQDFRGNGWGAKHATAWTDPKPGFERAIRGMIVSLAEYADATRERFESGIGSDGVLGDEWRDMVLATIALLNGETGRYDCGTLDRLLRDMLEAEGYDRDGNDKP